jgi:hypothetical protein
MTRLEKIRNIKEKELEKKANQIKLNVTILPGKLCPPPSTQTQPTLLANHPTETPGPSSPWT